MSSTSNYIFLLFLTCQLISCQNTEQTPKIQIDPNAGKEETAQMVQELAKLVQNGNSNDYYHWNTKKAQILKAKFDKAKGQERVQTGFKYVKQLINSGESQLAIETIHQLLNNHNKPNKNALTEMSRPMFELLALAYLRLGEQQNCLNNHTPQSCILPLQASGFHKDKTGSQEAIKIYSRLQEKFPNQQYKWLLNVAYMTVGAYPDGVPSKHRLQIPSKEELKDFPAFQDIAMSIGAASNGLSGSTSIDDFNNDGYLDIFATSYGMEDNVTLLLNDKKGAFTDVTEAAGLKGIVSGLNTMQVDYNNDGNLDLFILRGAWLGNASSHPNSLLKNMGDGTFNDVTRSSGMLSYHPTQTATWFDFNNDGNIDVFIGNENNNTKDNHPCELYQNNGDGTFTEVAASHGLGNIKEFVKGVTAGDIDNDGWTDLYISNLNGGNLLFKNDNGNFTNITTTAGVAEPNYSFPCWFWDVNNDGFQDIFVSGYDLKNMRHVAKEYVLGLEGKEATAEKPRLYINNGDGTFKESSKRYGIDKVMFAMGSNYGDLDNDGFLDFYIGTGTPEFNSIVPNRMFKNENGENFSEVTSVGNFGHIQKGHGVAFADIDRDGDQDIYAVMGGAYDGDTFTNVLFENPISKNNWIVIELKGTNSNRSAIGARIAITLDNGTTLYRTVSSGGSFGASSLQQEVGLGLTKQIKQITIQWPGNGVQVFTDINVNKKIKIKEGIDQTEFETYTYVPFAKNGHSMQNSN